MKPLLAAIDDEIKKLEEARRILAGAVAPGPKVSPVKKAGGRKRRRMSAEGRARIAEAQRKRWAAKKKTEKKKGKA
ncbi:MAG: hypothetical protein WBX09_18990 [Terracidiphilus sp.]